MEEATFAEGQLVKVVRHGSAYFGHVGRVRDVRRDGKWFLVEMPDKAVLLCFPGDLRKVD